MAKVGGRVARPDKWKRARGERIRALRDALSITQDVVADRGAFPRSMMSKFEKGDNAASTADAIGKLADGFEVGREEMRQYLDGEIELERVLFEVAALKHEPTVTAVELDPRYAALEAVLRAHPERWGAPAVAAARAIQLDADISPDESFWLETLDRIDTAISLSLPKLPKRAVVIDLESPTPRKKRAR